MLHEQGVIYENGTMKYFNIVTYIVVLLTLRHNQITETNSTES